MTLEQDLARDAMRDAVDTWESLPGHVETYWHADGSATIVRWDPAASDCDSPRDYDGNVATLINRNPRTIDVDTCEHYGLAEAVDRWGADDPRTGRYVAAFCPDILHFADYWHAGDSYGWGYVTRAAWDAAMGSDYAGEHTPAEAFASEVRIYGEWASGEVYAGTHLEVGAPIVAYGEHGAYVDGYDITEDDVYGFLGYEDLADIAASFTDSPVVDSQPEDIRGAA